MVCHGFDGGKPQSPKATEAQKEAVAKCISEIDGVLWAHVVHQGSIFDPKVDTKMQMRKDGDVLDRYDIIWERYEKLDSAMLQKIQQCALENGGHKMKIESFTVKEKSFKKGKGGKHPKKKELAYPPEESH